MKGMHAKTRYEGACVYVCVRKSKGNDVKDGKGQEYRVEGVNSFGMTDVGVFLAQTRQCLPTKLSSLVQGTFAWRCESYRLLELLGFLPAHFISLLFMCQEQRSGLAYNFIHWLPWVEPSVLYTTCYLQFSSNSSMHAVNWLGGHSFF